MTLSDRLEDELDSQGCALLPGLLSPDECAAVAVLLSEPGRDFEGGEFVLTEQRPRMQSRAEVVPLHQ